MTQLRMSSLENLFFSQLNDLLTAEQLVADALPRLAQSAAEPKLQAALADQWEESRTRAQRLRQVLTGLGRTNGATPCEAVRGLLRESAQIAAIPGDPAVRDAALVAAAQRLAHYEIASYGTVRTYAEMLGFTDAAERLQQSLDEEHLCNDRLTRLAVLDINADAM